MGDALFSVYSGLAGSALSIVLLPLVIRIPVFRSSPLFAHIGAAACGLALCLSLGALWSHTLDFWLAVSIVGFVAMANLFAFGAVQKSVSLRMLAVLTNQEVSGDLQQTTALLKDKVGQPLIDDRLKLLTRRALVRTLADGSYQVTDFGRLTSSRIQRIQRVFGITRTGLYGDKDP